MNMASNFIGFILKVKSQNSGGHSVVYLMSLRTGS